MDKRVEKYILKYVIDKGQFGVVYYAQNRETGQPYAVKQIATEKFRQIPKLTQLTNNQIVSLKKVRHDNIVVFIETIQTSNYIYLVYEYCNGGTLAQRMKKKVQMDQVQIVDIFVQIRAAYEELYNSKILHRDLKPSNILFHDTKVKLADFGFCKELLREEDIGKSIVGTPAYMAPEILQGHNYDYRADFWSLGIILYQMVYGFVPYQQKDMSRLGKLINNTKLKFPSTRNASEGMVNFMKRLLEPNFHQRIRAIQFFKYGLDNRVKPQKGNLTFDYVLLFIRRAMLYIVDSMKVVAGYIEDVLFLKFAFLLFKIFSCIQKDVRKRSPYWETIRITNTSQKWDFVIQNEANALQNYGRMVKQALLKQDSSQKIITQFQTIYISHHYFLELYREVGENDPKLRERLLDCFLINKHFISVMEKRHIDFTDYALSKLALEEKADLCFKYVRNRDNRG